MSRKNNMLYYRTMKGERKMEETRVSNYEKMKMEVSRILDEMKEKDPSSAEYKDLQERCKSLQAMINAEDEACSKAIQNSDRRDIAKKDRILGYAKIAAEVAVVGIGAVKSFIMFKEGLGFETEGTITSTIFRTFLNKNVK